VVKLQLTWKGSTYHSIRRWLSLIIYYLNLIKKSMNMTRIDLAKKKYQELFQKEFSVDPKDP